MALKFSCVRVEMPCKGQRPERVIFQLRATWSFQQTTFSVSLLRSCFTTDLLIDLLHHAIYDSHVDVAVICAVLNWLQRLLHVRPRSRVSSKEEPLGIYGARFFTRRMPFLLAMPKHWRNDDFMNKQVQNAVSKHFCKKNIKYLIYVSEAVSF